MDEIYSASPNGPVYKRIDDPWIGLLVLSILIPLLSTIGMIALYFFWRRSQQLRQVDNQSYILSNKPTGERQIPIQIEDQQPKAYDTQQMETYLPQTVDERIRTQFPPPDDIRQMNQFYERATKAYF